MVKLNIFVEGVADTTSGDFLAIDNSATFREAFHKLLIQHFSEEEFDLVIHPIGTVKQNKEKINSYLKNNENAIALFDLDGAPNQREHRLSYYHEVIRDKIFFMIQEMEAWILSQPEAIDSFASKKDLIKKRDDKSIEENSLLKGKNIQDVEKPSEKINTIFRQHFDELKFHRKSGKYKRKAKGYHKVKDAPELVSLLNFEKLTFVFEDANKLELHIESLKSQNE